MVKSGFSFFNSWVSKLGCIELFYWIGVCRLEMRLWLLGFNGAILFFKPEIKEFYGKQID